MSSVYYYCGNPAGKWDLLLAAGADALSLEESKKGFTHRHRGRGGASATAAAPCWATWTPSRVLQDGSEATLRAEIARQIAAGRRNGSRFIMSLGSPVTPGTPAEPRAPVLRPGARIQGKG